MLIEERCAGPQPQALQPAFRGFEIDREIELILVLGSSSTAIGCIAAGVVGETAESIPADSSEVVGKAPTAGLLAGPAEVLASISMVPNALSVLLREEGFARLPRRRDEERPSHIKPEPAEVADVRHLDLTPRAFRTRVAGLFLFVPLMKDLNLAQVAQQAQLPGSPLIPPEQALLALLALKQPLPQPVTFLLNLRKCAYHKELDRKELDRFFGVVSRQPVIRGITQSAVCQARHKLKPGAFLALNALLAF